VRQIVNGTWTGRPSFVANENLTTHDPRLTT